MKKYILLSILCVFLYACQKNTETPKTYVQGTVISFYDSSKVVPSATVYLYKELYFLVDSTKADANGKFRMEFTPQKSTMYHVAAKQKHYFGSSENYFYINSDRLFADKILIAAYPKSYIRVRIKDETRTKFYSGIRLNHTAYTTYKIIRQSPIIDSTTIIEGYYKDEVFSWGFINPDSTWQSRQGILFRTPIPLDTFDLLIKF